MRFHSSSNPSTRNTLRTNGDKRFTRSSKKLLTCLARLRSVSTINMDRSCFLVSSVVCLRPKVSTQTRSPQSLRPCTYGASAHDQKSPQVGGKNGMGHCPPRPSTPMDRVPNSYRHRAFPTCPLPRSSSYLLRITHAGIRHPRPTLAWGSIPPTFIRVLRCRWIKNFWIRYRSCRILSGRIQLCQVSLSSAVLRIFIVVMGLHFSVLGFNWVNQLNTVSSSALHTNDYAMYEPQQYGA